MVIVPYVCAEFHNPDNGSIHKIRPDELKNITQAPDWIRGELLFDMLVRDGSIKIPETAGQKKQLEQDPMIGMAATGKTVEAETGKPPKPVRTVKAEKTAK